MQVSEHQTNSRALDSNTETAYEISYKVTIITFMMTKLLIFLALLILYLVEARHFHPRHVVNRMEEAEMRSEAIMEIDGLPINVIRNLSPNRFVPINNMIFFKNYGPCEEGLERDLLGVCREVWD